MSKVLEGNACIGQSGGPTAVINQSLVGVVEELKKFEAVGKIYGAHHAVSGIVKEDFIDLTEIDADKLEKVANTPAAALGSSRDKPDEEYCREIFTVFKKYNIRYFFYIGGNDSADTARIVNEMAGKEHYELRVFHIPKTIDNDLRTTDHCPGYGSAAKFVAQAFMGDDRDSAALPGIKINVVMGRHAGWLTAASVLGRERTKDGPHLVYVPEVPFDEQKFVEDVDAVYTELGRCQIAVSEGISNEKGEAIAAVLAERLGKEVERDSHGNVQLSGSGALGDFLADYLKQELGKKHGSLRVRADTFGYLQRSFFGIASDVDQREARQCGRKAVEYAQAGNIDGSVVMKRLTGEDYVIEYQLANLEDVARYTKDLPREMINEAGNNIDQSFVDYAMPLVGDIGMTGKLF
ncbi:MAG: 6-phosphofructokinase [Phycisphaerae bacterium]